MNNHSCIQPQPLPVSTPFLEERSDGSMALYIEGDLQFDTRDEALYHEALVLPALCLARRRSADDRGLRVLVCGGGDGLALREALRFPGVEHVDLVDYSEAVVSLGRDALAGLNMNAFHDPRTSTIIADAWEYLSSVAESGDAGYHVAVCDFTVPRRPGDSRVFTREWYELLQKVMAPDGIIAVNSLSPQQTPKAFACLMSTIAASGLNVVPYRVCLPSFYELGYGIWSFTLCGNGLDRSELADLDCPVTPRQANLDSLHRGAEFAEPWSEEWTPVNTLEHDALLPLILNPGMKDERLPEILSPSPEGVPFDLDPLLRALPILHPYHTRSMVETLAAQVAPTINALDIKRLLNELLERASRLPEALRRELERVREFLNDGFEGTGGWYKWGCRLFAILFIVITLANSISPDNAFAKGSYGAHGSFSSSHASAFHVSGEPVGGAPHITSEGFRSGYGSGAAVDSTGRTYTPQSFRYRPSGIHYWHGGGGHVGGHHNASTAGTKPADPPKQQTHTATFVADKDLLVLDNGDVVVTLSNRAYLLVSQGKVALMSKDSDAPLTGLYPDPKLFESIKGELKAQRDVIRREIRARDEWLVWVGWTGSFVPAVERDQKELLNLKDLSRRLDTALRRIGAPPAGATACPLPAAGEVELFTGAILRQDGTTALRLADGRWMVTDGRQQWTDTAFRRKSAAAPGLRDAISTVIARRCTEIKADVRAANNDLATLSSDRTLLESDLREYQSIYASNYYDPSYEVDYGTDSIPVSEAISRTEADLLTNTGDAQQTVAARDKLQAEYQTLSSVGGVYGTRQ